MPSPTVSIRSERPSDYERVRAIHEAAFGRPHEARLVDQLRAAASPMLSLVAEIATHVVGHGFFSPVTIEPSRACLSAGGLAPVAVDPSHQAAGIGSALIRLGLEQCPHLGWQAIFLVGDPAYYSRFGFVLAAPMGFTYGDPFFDRALQVVELTPGAVQNRGGRVRFHSAFAESGTG